MFAPVGFMTKEEVYKQKTQKHMEDVGCVSSGLKKKHKNTQNTKGVTLFICPFEAKKKHKNTQNTHWLFALRPVVKNTKTHKTHWVGAPF